MAALNRTENHILFDCEVDLLLRSIDSPQPIFEKVTNYIKDYEDNDGEELNNNFSHDNWKGVACWLKVFSPGNLKRVPLWGRHSLRPDNFLFFLYAKYKWIGIWFVWIYLLFQVFDAIRMRKAGNGYPHTSGLLLNYFVLQTFGFNWTFQFVNWRVNQVFKPYYVGCGGWNSVFHIYYTEDHNKRVLYAYLSRNWGR